MSYDEKAFDFARLQRYAAHVAQTRSGEPHSVLAVFEERSVAFKGWFSSRVEKSRGAGTAAAGGWILLVDASEGRVVFSGLQFNDGYIRGDEEGRLLLLTPEGKLMTSQYIVAQYRPTAGTPWDQHELLEKRLADAGDIVSFDRLNRAEYREVWHRGRAGRQAAAAARDVWRRDLGRRWQVRVPHAGMEVSRALKAFKERGTYIARLEIRY
jgi:hypothetical protein